MDIKTNTLVALLGMSRCKRKSPSQSCLEYFEQSESGIKPEEIEVFKTDVEILVKHYLYVLKRHIQQNG